MCTTEKPSANFGSVTYHFAATVFTGRCQRLDRAFKAVERVSRTRRDNFETLVVLVAANLALRHGNSPQSKKFAQLSERNWMMERAKQFFEQYQLFMSCHIQAGHQPRMILSSSNTSRGGQS